MSVLRYFVVVFFLTVSAGQMAHAKGDGGFGLNVGMGFPFLGQAGFNYYFTQNFSLSGGYNVLDVSVNEASAKLTMPEIMLNYHPFSGAFFIGAGVGQESLEVTATQTGGTNQASIDVDAMTTVAKLGWMWGRANGGFWFGMDIGYVIPSGADVKISSGGVPTTDPSYIDAVDAADKFGKTAYPNFTFARFGWLF